MRQFIHKEFTRILKYNGYCLDRIKGSHHIYIKDNNHISVPKNLKSVIALRLIKENNLIVKTK